MATATQNVIADNSTDANFRAWVTAIHTQMLAMGLLATADTGQVDHTTVTRPTVAQTVMGYKMYRFDDVHQAAAPVLVKVEFGSAGVATYPSIWVTAGRATDGAGNFTGSERSTRRQLVGISGGAAAVHLCIFSGANNRIAVVMWNSADVGFWFVIERSKDGAGADSTEGIIIMMGERGGGANFPGAWQQFVPMSGGPPTLETRIAAITSSLSSGAFGLSIGVGVPIPLAGGPKNYGICLLMYASGDFAANTIIAVSLYSTARNYYTVGNFFPAHNGIQTSRIAILYQ